MLAAVHRFAFPNIEGSSLLSGSLRDVKITEQRTGVDFAEYLRELVDLHYPRALQIRLVLDNLLSHSPGALYECLPPAEARRILSRLEFHHTPKHASWLNHAEIEIGALRQRCLDRRLSSREALATEIAAWKRTRNAERVPIKWLFTVSVRSWQARLEGNRPR